jgi:hypothetical protein
MSPSSRNSMIYLFAGIAALFLVSRFVTVALMLTYAPEDAEPYFYLKQILISAVCAGVIVWLWSRRIRQRGW